MTVTSDQSRQTFLGSPGSSTSSFGVPFYLQSADQLTVTQFDATGNSRTLVLNTDYTITNTRAYVGWIVNLIDPVERTPLPLTVGSLAVQRVPTLTQEVDLRNQGAYFAEVQEDALDYLTIITQWLRDQLVDAKLALTTAVTQTSQFFKIFGSTSGSTTLTTDPIAGNGTVNFPSATGVETVAYANRLASTATGQGDALLAVLQPFTGAVPRTQHLKNSDSVSPADFGAVGDGLTDDTAALTAALVAYPILNLTSGKTYLVAGVSVPGGSVILGNGATLELKTLGHLVLTPILNVTGPGVVIKDLNFNGNRAAQYADAFSDSYDTGANGTGRANRCAVKYDGGGTERYGLSVLDCTFTQMWGASIATRDISNVLVDGCYFHDNNFEGLYCYYTLASGNRNTHCKVVNCVGKNIASGDGSINADCFVLSQCDYAEFSNNSVYNFERDMVKLENCNYSTVIGNTCDTNTLVYAGVQMQSGGIMNKVVGNTLLNTCIGVQVESGVYTDIDIADNVISLRNTTIGAPDGIQALGITRCTISGNVLKNVNRMGLYVQDSSSVIIIGNNINGYTSTSFVASYAIQVGTLTAVQSDVLIANNLIGKFAGATGSAQGAITVAAGTYALSNLVIMGNVIHTMTDDNTSRGIFFAGQVVPNCSIINNTVYGIVEVYPTALTLLGNQILRVNTPSSMGNLRGQGSTSPAAGTFYVGDTWLNTAPAAGGSSYMGWVCTTAGSPGTWKGFGLIQT